jgi:hypothetical protein
MVGFWLGVLVSLKRKVIIKRHRPYEHGKYGLTISEPGQGGAFTVRPLGDENKLSNLLLELGFSQPEIEDIMAELDKVYRLQPSKAYIERIRSFDAALLEKHGF